MHGVHVAAEPAHPDRRPTSRPHKTPPRPPLRFSSSSPPFPSRSLRSPSRAPPPAISATARTRRAAVSRRLRPSRAHGWTRREPSSLSLDHLLESPLHLAAIEEELRSPHSRHLRCRRRLLPRRWKHFEFFLPPEVRPPPPRRRRPPSGPPRRPLLPRRASPGVTEAQAVRSCHPRSLRRASTTAEPAPFSAVAVGLAPVSYSPRGPRQHVPLVELVILVASSSRFSAPRATPASAPPRSGRRCHGHTAGHKVEIPCDNVGSGQLFV